MRCPECGASGYSRKTKIPEWRCRDSECGYEWDANSPNENPAPIRPDLPRVGPRYCPYCLNVKSQRRLDAFRRAGSPDWLSVRTTTGSYDYVCGECDSRWDAFLDVADIEASITPLEREEYQRRVKASRRELRKSLVERLGGVTWLIVGPWFFISISAIVRLIKTQPVGDLTWLMVAPLVLSLVAIIVFIFYPD